MFGIVKNKIVKSALLCNLLVLSFLTLDAQSAQASQWQGGLQHAGFMGSMALSVGLLSESQKYGFELGLGFSQDENKESVQQLNFKFRWQPLQFEFGNKGKLVLPYIGIQGMYALGSEFFLTNDSVYPEENYYDYTAFRLGIPVGVAWNYGQFTIYSEYVLIDTDLIAQFNTKSASKYSELASASVGLRFSF